MPDGLEDSGLALVEDAADRGVRLSAVNIMAMNHSSSHRGGMGDDAEQAAAAAHDQLVDVLGMSQAAAWQALHLTVMIGVDDVAGGTFTRADAASLRGFATRKGSARSPWGRPSATGRAPTARTRRWPTTAAGASHRSRERAPKP